MRIGKVAVRGDAHLASERERMRRVAVAFAGFAVLAVTLLGSPPNAWAGAGFGVLPSIPANVTVGDTNVPTSLVLRNISSNGSGETNFDTDSFMINDITLVPSCGSQVFSSDCPVGSRDPGVIVPDPLTGTGRSGTACAGRTFAISLIDAAQGKYRFTPDASIVVGPSGGPQLAATCAIDFTSRVLKAPTIDSDAVATGRQTDQKAFTEVEDITVGSPNFGLTAGGIGTARTTIARATPALTTQASVPITLGSGTLTDTANITGLVNPITTGAGVGTVEFQLFGPGDTSCATAIFTSSNRPLTFSAGNTAASATSAAFTPTAAGTYRWRAFFSGDANNNAANGPCNAANESVVVSPANPALTTQASGPITLGGGTLSDTANITGLSNPITTGGGAGTVEFRLYGPGDTSCATAIFTSSNRPLTFSAGNTEASATSASFTPTAAGTYRWRAFFSGDANNNAASGPCNAANESVVVNPATPAITTEASTPVALGGSMTDVARLTGLVNPVTSGPNVGTVEFRLYAPGDTSCATAIFTSSNRPLTFSAGDTAATATSGSFTPTAVGTYRWRAFFSGDANNNAVSGACNDANESVTVTPANPSITTDASGTVVLGGSVNDVAHVTGLVNPVTSGPNVGTIEFRLYGPNDATCATAIFTSSNRPLTFSAGNTAATATSASFTPTASGTYRWRAFFSGDANNAAVSGACNDVNEAVFVSPASPGILTQASADMTIGNGALADNATVTGLVNPVTSGPNVATVEFRLYGPNDASCATAVFTSSNRPLTFNAGGTSATAVSTAFTPTSTGTYRWRAFYSGDANNNPVNGPCNAANETTNVRPASPTIETQASADIVLGAGTLGDIAIVSGLVNPIATGPGAGTVEFRLYGPNDATCSTAIFTSANRSLTLDAGGTQGVATSAAYTPSVAGTYRWRAFYSGDVNNNPISGACNDANEITTVTNPPPPPVAPPPPPPPPPVAPPPPPPPPPPPAVAAVKAAEIVCTPPPGPAPAGGELCARGTAAVRGKSGCQGTPFNVVVTGREIQRVIFARDGKVVRNLTAPNSGVRYVLRVNPRSMTLGLHRVLARIVFTSQSGTRTRTLRVVFSRCARKALSPAFTG